MDPEAAAVLIIGLYLSLRCCCRFFFQLKVKLKSAFFFRKREDDKKCFAFFFLGGGQRESDPHVKNLNGPGSLQFVSLTGRFAKLGRF